MNLLYIINLFLTLIIILSSCSSSRPPRIRSSFVEDVMLATLILDNDFLLYNMEGSSRGNPELTRLSPSEIELMKSMIKNNYQLSIAYESEKATAVIDISESGVVEWYNVNILNTKPDAFWNINRVKVLYFRYTNGRWFFVDDRQLGQSVLEGWPDIPRLN